jgi:hypothetical protein
MRRKYSNKKGKEGFSWFLKNLHEIILSILVALWDNWKYSKITFVVMLGGTTCLGIPLFLSSFLFPWSWLKRMDFAINDFRK